MLTTDWTPNNGAYFDTQTFAIGDVHGQCEALKTLLDHLESLPAQPLGTRGDNELIFLGDLIDRGPDSLGTVQAAFDTRGRFDLVHLLPGNHELMLLAAMMGDRDALFTWMANGGSEVIDEVDPTGKQPSHVLLEALQDALPPDWAATYRDGPTHLRRGREKDVLFVHAGIDPHRPLDEALGADRFGRDDNHWAWIRQPFLGWQAGWGHLGLSLVVHGHSPATTQPIETLDDLANLLDVVAPYGCICLDAGAMRRPQVAAVEFAADQHRLHLVEDAQTD